MRIARYFALLVGLGTVGFAVGDWASHPNVLGVVGLVLLIVACSLLLAYLFRPDPALRERPEPRPDPKPRAPRAESHVWAAGWDAGEARAARERRSERRP
jgi:hypothetical protein